MSTAVIYARYSSDMQTENSIDAQVRACREYANAHNFDVVGVFADRAISGTTDKRPEFQRALRQECDVFLVHKLDRFSRDRYDHAVYGKLLKDRGVRLIAAAEDFGEGKTAVLMSGITQALSEYYIENLREETKKGQKERALKGLHNGGLAPFGYDVRDGKYVINEAEAFWVKRIFAAALAGNGYTELIEEITKSGVRGKRGHPIKYTQIYEILRNEKYTGDYLYCTEENKKRDYRRTKEGCIRIENCHPALVSHEDFERIQEIINSHKQTGRGSKREYLLSGRVKCSCGSTMHASTPVRKGHEYPQYRCPNCHRSISESEANEAVFKYIKMLLKPDVKNELAQQLAKFQKSEAATQTNGRLIADKEADIAALVNNLASGVLPQEAVAAIGKRIQELRYEIEQMKKPIPTRTIVNFISEIADIKKQSPDKQRELIKRYVLSVTASPESVCVTSTFDEVLGKLGCGGRI